MCLAGGVGLNAVAVGRIVAEGPFEDVFVMPAAGDAGAAVGAAMLPNPVQSPLRHVALGEALDPDATRRFFDDCGIGYTEHEGEGIAEAVAEKLAAGAVVGWMQGRFELGPRALGQRSILCDPRDPGAKDRLNSRVKHRESFRPFAPRVLAQLAEDLFVLPPPRAPGLAPPGACTRRFITSPLPAPDASVP